VPVHGAGSYCTYRIWVHGHSEGRGNRLIPWIGTSGWSGAPWTHFSLTGSRCAPVRHRAATGCGNCSRNG
jgi:hypothetical protein